jgi:hypothetical protein
MTEVVKVNALNLGPRRLASMLTAITKVLPPNTEVIVDGEWLTFVVPTTSTQASPTSSSSSS